MNFKKLSKSSRPTLQALYLLPTAFYWLSTGSLLTSGQVETMTHWITDKGTPTRSPREASASKKWSLVQYCSVLWETNIWKPPLCTTVVKSFTTCLCLRTLVLVLIFFFLIFNLVRRSRIHSMQKCSLYGNSTITLVLTITKYLGSLAKKDRTRSRCCFAPFCEVDWTYERFNT